MYFSAFSNSAVSVYHINAAWDGVGFTSHRFIRYTHSSSYPSEKRRRGLWDRLSGSFLINLDFFFFFRLDTWHYAIQTQGSNGTAHVCNACVWGTWSLNGQMSRLEFRFLIFLFSMAILQSIPVSSICASARRECREISGQRVTSWNTFSNFPPDYFFFPLLHRSTTIYNPGEAWSVSEFFRLIFFLSLRHF